MRYSRWILPALLWAGLLPAQTAPPRSRYVTVLTNPEIEHYLERNDVIIVPVGTAESMGSFPTDLEYTMAEAFALKMAEAGDALVLPHLIYFYPGVTAAGRGSVHVDQDVGLAYLKAVAHSLLRQGFRRQIYVSAHGPSDQYVAALVRTFFDETKDPIVYIDVTRAVKNAQANGAAAPASTPNNFRAVGYGAYRITNRLADVPLRLEMALPSTPALAPAPTGLQTKLAPLGPSSGTVGSYEPDANHSQVRPLEINITAAERERLGREGAALIEASVKTMDVPGILQAMREYDRYVQTVLVPRYGNVLPH